MPSVIQISLSEVIPGEKFIISKIQLSPETNQRLLELGLREAAEIRTIVNSDSKLICEVNNTRIGINHKIAKDILVTPVN
jgi:Fe2+ transport system protein FeoA